MGEVVAAWTFFMLRSWIKQTALNEELRAKLQSEHCFAAPSMRSANRLQAFARHLCSGGEQEVTESESTECRFFSKQRTVLQRQTQCGQTSARNGKARSSNGDARRLRERVVATKAHSFVTSHARRHNRETIKDGSTTRGQRQGRKAINHTATTRGCRKKRIESIGG